MLITMPIILQLVKASASEAFIKLMDENDYTLHC